MATNKPQDDYQKQGVRIPRDLHQRIHEAAAASGRSYNSELVQRLEDSFLEQESPDLLDATLELTRWHNRQLALQSELSSRLVRLQLTEMQLGQTTAAAERRMLAAKVKELQSLVSEAENELTAVRKELAVAESRLAHVSTAVIEAESAPPAKRRPKKV